MPPEPEPIDALIYALDTKLDVTFDIQLQTVILGDTANWTVIWGGLVHTVVLVVISNVTATLDLIPTIVPAAPDGVTYAPPPFDVRGLAGGLGQPFADFPLHA